MLDHVPPQLRLFTAKFGNITLRFVMPDEPDAVVWLVLRDVLAAAGYPRATRRRMLKTALRRAPVELRTVDIQGRESLLIRRDDSLELMMHAAELDYCPSYLADEFEVVASYARDELQPCDPPAHSDLIAALCSEGGE